MRRRPRAGRRRRDHDKADAVVCAAGHSADDVYDALEAAGAKLEAKPVAVGFRVEHPRPLVNGLAYGDLACRVVTGNSRTDKANLLRHPTDEALSRDSEALLLPVAAYRLAADVGDHSIYSFCMCPGGQVVPALTKPSEMVVNGMSYSRRHSLFANAALVVRLRRTTRAWINRRVRGASSPSSGLSKGRRQY